MYLRPRRPRRLVAARAVAPERAGKIVRGWDQTEVEYFAARPWRAGGAVAQRNGLFCHHWASAQESEKERFCGPAEDGHKEFFMSLVRRADRSCPRARTAGNCFPHAH